MQLSNQYYDMLKWLVLIFLPALAVLLSGIGTLYSWQSAEQWVALINLIAIFIGSLIQVSSKQYYLGGSEYGNHSKTFS